MTASRDSVSSPLSMYPGPLLIVVLALMGVFGLQIPRSQETVEQGLAVQTELPTPADSTHEEHTPTFPPIVLLREYLNSDAPPAQPVQKLELAQKYELSIPPAASEPLLTVESRKVSDSPNNSGKESVLVELRRMMPDCDYPRLKCLIATIPDPIDSHIPLMCDNVISAICRGFERHDFVLDRRLLLWSNDSVTDLRTDFRKYPSAILFRRVTDAADEHAEDVSELVLLLLVGETVTGGVHKEALSSALEFVAIHQLLSEKRVFRIPLLGPNFSGATPSLRFGIVNWWKQWRRRFPFDLARINVICGSATSDSNWGIMTQGKSDVSLADIRLNRESHRDPDWDQGETPGLRIDFKATMLPDSATMSAVMWHLIEDRGIPRRTIALLVESGTGWGNGVFRYLKDEYLKQKSAEEEKEPSVRILPFPMGLSRLRSEYAKRESARPEPGEEYAKQVRKNFDLSMRESEWATDVLPIFSDSRPAVIDITLEQILATIARDDIRAVGLFATDIRDTLFLAEQIRTHTPGVQLFTIDSDVLCTHARYTESMAGTLVACSYPLFPRSRNWTLHRNDLAFPTDVSQGVYNATLVHLNELCDDEFGPHREDQPLLDYATPFKCQKRNRPPVWLTIVGERALWPVKVVPVSEVLKHYGQKNDARVANQYTHKERSPDRGKFLIFAPPSLSALVSGLVSLGIAGMFVLINLWSPVPWAPRFASWLVLRDSPLDRAGHKGDKTPVSRHRRYAMVLFLGLGVCLRTAGV